MTENDGALQGQMLGRIDAKLESLTEKTGQLTQKMDESHKEITSLKIDVVEIKAKQPEKSKWWQIVGGIAAVATLSISIYAILSFLMSK